ncbi:MAG: T9SS type A sorting domain-containing protein [Flavobacteriales bacterium]|nr:T9SS type A sorting domain-containing protein [Flavobacteriales bacterium]
MRCSLSSAFFACFLVVASSLQAQSIADARNAPLGSSVTINGIVTSGPSLGGIRYVQDASGGIAAFPGSGSVPGFAPQQGDDITLSGTLTEYSGLLEVTPISAFTIHSSGNPLPAPLVITPAQLDEAVESQLVRLDGVYFSGSGTFTSGLWPVQVGTQTANIYFRSGHPMIGMPVPSGPVDITGIASQFDSAPFTGGYQLLPRATTDITPHALISIVPPVQQQALVTDGFTLSWQTNLPGSTEAFYGTTPAFGSHAGGTGSTTAHDLQLSGLQPATFYYAQAFSVANGDTAFSVTGLYSTASTSSGAIHVYFTKSVDTSVSSGTDAIGLFQATDDTIKAYIDRAQQTLDIAIYNTNSTYIVSAVNAAHDRGVQVRWIAEGSNANSALAGLDPSIPVLYRTDGQGSGMHNKFFVIDAEDPARATIMGGSCNWTVQSFFDDYNNILFIQDQALARCYRMEFEEMWGGSGAQPVQALSKFGPNKTDNTPHLFNVGGVLVESYFSPTDGVTGRIAQAIDDAQSSVRLALYVFTQNELGDAVVDAFNRPGMLVAGDVEDVNSQGSEFNYLVGQGIDLHSHEAEPGLLHHKYAILDEGISGDPRVITGSHNWTNAAETVNDENTLVIHNATVANLFYQEWNARHNDATAIREEQGKPGISAWPVPASNWINVKPTTAGLARITLHDATGREVYHTEAQGRTTISVAELPAGLYTLSCLQDGVRSQRAVMVVR